MKNEADNYDYERILFMHKIIKYGYSIAEQVKRNIIENTRFNETALSANFIY